MELFQVDIAGFRKFKEPTNLKTRGKTLAILGANEAGKSSLLQALVRLNDSDPFASNDKSRGVDDGKIFIKARFLLSDADREIAGVPNAIWYIIEKGKDGQRSWWIEPRPADRDYSHRPKLHAAITDIQSKTRAVSLISELDVELLPSTERFFSSIHQNRKDLSDADMETLTSLSNRWIEAVPDSSFGYLRTFSENLASAAEVESTKSARLAAGERLWGEFPEFLLFGNNDRNLKSSYTWAELSTDIPEPLNNLAKVAELDLARLISIITTNSADPEIDTMIERANLKLEKNFQTAWKQSAVSVVLAPREDSLLIQVYNNERQRTELGQRSDGLRQFVALRCFTTARETENFILLIDEAEQHLHYDAQADLVQMLASQTVAAKVIYTTHSVGCLPEDLGNGVRLVEPTKKDSDWSKIENKFWVEKKENEAAFSPILMGMGASTMAFFPTRSAVLIEGPADTILMPTMFREALELENLGVQFVHGLSEDGQLQLPLLNSTGRNVCYLLDDDDGGRKLVNDLEKRKVDKRRIFQLRQPDGDCELEDFIDPALLAQAASAIGSRHLNVAELLKSASMPKFGKWDHVEATCKAAKVGVLSKVDVAYEILEILDSNPSRNILDKRLKQSFKKVAEKVLASVKPPAVRARVT